MSLRVIEHYPGINTVDIPRNPVIDIKFNQGIILNSLDYTHLSLNDYNYFTTVPGTLELHYNTSGVADTIHFTPTINLSPYAKYRFYVYGSPNSVISTANEQLDTTYQWSFTTGSGLLEGTGSGVSESGVSESGVSNPFEGHTLHGGAPIDASTFYVYKTDPTNQEPNITNDLERIVLTFTGFIDHTCRLYRYITVEEEPVI